MIRANLIARFDSILQWDSSKLKNELKRLWDEVQILLSKLSVWN